MEASMAQGNIDDRSVFEDLKDRWRTKEPSATASSWKSVLPDKESKSSSTSESNSSGNSSGKKASISVASGGSKQAEQMMSVANDILLSIYNEDLGSIKGLLSKIDELVEAANPSDSKSIEASKADLSKKAFNAAEEKYKSVLMMLAGVDGAAALYDKASADYNNFSSLRQRLEDNPQAYIAYKKAQMYNELSNYIKAAGDSIAYERVGVGNMVNGIANIFQAHAQQGLNAFNQEMSLRSDARQELQSQQNTAVHNNNMINQQTQIILSKYGLPEAAYADVRGLVSRNDEMTKTQFNRELNKIINDFTVKKR
jgi:hypothetical protein